MKKSILIVKELIGENMKKLFENEKELQKFLSIIIDEIWLYSRDRLPTDVVRGGKTKQAQAQKIPYKMKIRFKLPQEFLKEYFRGSVVIN